MESSGLGGGLFSGIGSGMLGLEMPLHQNPPNRQNPNSSLQHPHMVNYDPHHPQSNQIKPSGYPYSSSKSKQTLTLSDDDEPGFNNHEEISGGGDPKKINGGGGGENKSSTWQRMKWTDTMVRLLIMAVYYIGDEGGPETNDPKKNKSGGLLQKKGKWKSVSRAMMEKGFYVSPQQCEDKFNDLNKRYKRVNDILGKGTACRVVENQGLLETMELSPKMKEEVKKLLNSKHLFFREMCAYHTSCGHGEAGGAHNSPEQPPHQLQQKCLHGTTAENHLPMVEKNVPGSCRVEADSSKVGGRGGGIEYDHDDDSDDDSDDSDDNDDDDDEHENDRKRQRRFASSASPAQTERLNDEVMGVVRDSGKTPWEKKQWVKGKMLQLEEEQVWCRVEAYEIERQRLKWLKYSGKKEREMERAKLENERRLLENERLVLLFRQKELELIEPHLQQNNLASNKRIDPSSITG